MRLIDLEPQFYRREERIETRQVCSEDHRHTDECGERLTRPVAYRVPVSSIGEAQGVGFLCPVCFAKNNGPVGTHHVICWSRSKGIPDSAEPGPGRWRLVGTGFHDLSLMEEPGQSRSVALIGGCAWHGYVTDGEVTNA